jgi:hypothetical protein
VDAAGSDGDDPAGDGGAGLPEVADDVPAAFVLPCFP